MLCIIRMAQFNTSVIFECIVFENGMAYLTANHSVKYFSSGTY